MTSSPPSTSLAEGPGGAERMLVLAAVRRVWVTAAICGLTLLGYFAFPGHTYLESDAQIYVPILEHLRNASTLARDPIASHPHVAYTLFDEVSIAMRWLLGTGFEQVLTIQQVGFRALALLGVYWIAMAFGLSSRMGVLVAEIYSLGATIVGPVVLTFEYEPVPRGFAVGLVLLSTGMLARGRTLGAALIAAAALLYHPPAVWTFWILLGSLLAWRMTRGPEAGGAARRGLMVGVGALLLLLLLGRFQSGITEPQVFFSRIDAAHEKLLELRTPYIFVSRWGGDVVGMYVFLWAVSALAWFRLRREGTRALNWILLGLPLAGLLSIPLSWLLLEKLHWGLAPQLQPARATLFITATAVILSAIAGVKAVTRGGHLEALGWFAASLAPPISARVLDLFHPGTPLVRQRLFLLAALAALAVVVARSERWSRVWAATGICALALLAARAIPDVARVENYPHPDRAYIENIALWAELGTRSDALFHFPDAGREHYPGVFRARALRAVYVDWKGGGQMNFLPKTGDEWWRRWQETMLDRIITVDDLADFERRGIDFVVVKAGHAIRGVPPAYQNGVFVVYRLKRDELVRIGPPPVPARLRGPATRSS